MSYQLLGGDVLYISEDGNYGGGELIITSFSDFTEEQLDTLGDLGDNSKFDYALAVLNGEDLSEWEG